MFPYLGMFLLGAFVAWLAGIALLPSLIVGIGAMSAVPFVRGPRSMRVP